MKFWKKHQYLSFSVYKDLIVDIEWLMHQTYLIGKNDGWEKDLKKFIDKHFGKLKVVKDE